MYSALGIRGRDTLVCILLHYTGSLLKNLLGGRCAVNCTKWWYESTNVNKNGKSTSHKNPFRELFSLRVARRWTQALASDLLHHRGLSEKYKQWRCEGHSRHEQGYTAPYNVHSHEQNDFYPIYIHFYPINIPLFKSAVFPDFTLNVWFISFLSLISVGVKTKWKSLYN